jgi:hypothetical protein
VLGAPQAQGAEAARASCLRIQYSQRVGLRIWNLKFGE